MKRIETPETLTGGRTVLTAQTREDLTSHQMEIVAVGAPSMCDDEDCERPHCEITERGWDYLQTFWGHDHYIGEGDWVLVAPRSLVETDQAGLYCCHSDDILAILEA